MLSSLVRTQFSRYCSQNLLWLSSACQAGRVKLGFPADWSRVDSWLSPDQKPSYPSDAVAESLERKYPDIPILEDYSKVPNKSFWDNFPKRDLPRKPKTKINVKNLRKLIEESKSLLTRTELRRANRVVYDLITVQKPTRSRSYHL